MCVFVFILGLNRTITNNIIKEIPLNIFVEIIKPYLSVNNPKIGIIKYARFIIILFTENTVALMDDLVLSWRVVSKTFSDKLKDEITMNNNMMFITWK